MYQDVTGGEIMSSMDEKYNSEMLVCKFYIGGLKVYWTETYSLHTYQLWDFQTGGHMFSVL